MRNHREDEAKERERRERQERDEALEAAAVQKRKAEEETKKAFDAKKKDLEEKIVGIKNYISTQNKNMSLALEKGLKLTDPSSIKTNMYTVQFCQKNIQKKTGEMDKLNEDLKHHIGKRHRR